MSREVPISTARPGASRPDGPAVVPGRLRLAFWAATTSLVAVFTASSAPVPLFNTYRSMFGFTTADISLAVVCYFAGTIFSLLFLGRLASHVGRRPTAVATLALLAAGCLVLLHVSSLGWLLGGRLLMGLGAGLASSGLTSYIVDAAPSRPLWVASVASSQAPNLGLAIGAIGAGTLVEYGPWPTGLVYVVAAIWLGVSAVLIAVSPETVPPSPGAWASLRPRVHVPARALPLLPVATAVFVATWSIGAFYQAFVPSLVADQLHTTSSLVFGLVFCSYMAPNVLGAPISGRFTAAGAQRVGMTTFLVGVALIVAGTLTGSLPVFVAGSLIGGAGQGIAMSGAVRGLLHGSDASQRAPIFAAIFLISYGGAAASSFLSGQLAHTVPLIGITAGYGVLALVATLIVLPFARNPADPHAGVHRPKEPGEGNEPR